MKFVNRQDVKTRINEILLTAIEDERAHSMEDALRSDVLYTIGQNMLTREEMALLTLEALRTDAIDFARWCA